MKLPPKKRPGNPILASDWNTLIDALEARTPRPGMGLELVSAAGGFTFRARKSSASESSQSTNCPFGEIITYQDGDTLKTGIQGGVVYAGDKVWDVEPKALTLTATGTYKVWLEVNVTANVEDEVLLPGIKTSTEPAWKQSGDSYPTQTMPTAPSGTGKAIIALGTLTLKDGKANFVKTGCGVVRIDHCPGTLTHTRF